MKKLWVILFAVSPILLLGMRDVDKVHAQWVENRPDKSTSILIAKPKPAKAAITTTTVKLAVKEKLTTGGVTKYVIPKTKKDYIYFVADSYGMPRELLYNQLMYESGLNPNARGRAGEIGMAQYMPYNIIPEYKKNHRMQIESMASRMRRGYLSTGSWEKALQLYNCGHTKNVPASTKRYVKNVLGR